MEKLLDFSTNKVQTITMEQLRATSKEKDIYGNPMKGIYHYDLIDRICQMCTDNGYDVEIFDLFAAQNRDGKCPGVNYVDSLLQKYGNNAVEATILRRVYANIRLTNFDDEENTTNIAIAYHQRGIQVGFGNMVYNCHNQCMLGADQYVATYNDKGKGKGDCPDVPQILETVASWLLNARHIVETDRARMQRMQETFLGAEQIYLLIGMLTTLRVQCDSTDKSIRINKTYPLNQSQICQFTEGLLKKQLTQDKISVWDVYNEATNLYKAGGMDIPQLLPQNRAMVEFLAENYGI